MEFSGCGFESHSGQLLATYKKPSMVNTIHTPSSILNIIEPLKIKGKKTGKSKNPKPDLTREEKTAMEEQAQRTDIIITNADKGGS